jgi:DNA repair photolyase
MRWAEQGLTARAEGALPRLDQRAGLIRTVTADEFPGMRLHEVVARSALNPVPAGSSMPFRWTINPYRGCEHACLYCYARSTHAWLDLGTGVDFDREIVVKVNLVEVLTRELARASWRHELVALGTNTDPYQRAEGRYRLMPGVIGALARSGTPLSIVTKGSLLRRDLPELVAAGRDVAVGLAVSIAVHEPRLQRALEPGTPTPAARLAVVAAARAAGLACGVFLTPVLPWLTDSVEHLDGALAAIAATGATGVSVQPLYLRPGSREWFWRWLSAEHPELVPRYQRLYSRGAYVPPGYRSWLAERVAPLLARHGLGSGQVPEARIADAVFPDGAVPGHPGGKAPAGHDGSPRSDDGVPAQLTLL